MKKILFSAFLIFLLTSAFSQEVVSNLKYNSVLFPSLQKNALRIRSIGAERDTLCLPFFDDFSNKNVFLDSVSAECNDTVYNTNKSAYYPNQLFWTDSDAFINNTYPILPPSYGVATLDGLDKNGVPWNAFSNLGPADTLTSKPINLSGTVPDVYLSFYYQPGGYGDFPEETDSLILDFKKDDSTWQRVWFATNLSEDNQPFLLAMIPVTDPAYLYKGFQFRFRNWATVKGNNDHWNIDYVFMNDDRSADDTLFRDVAFIENPTQFLKNYRQMPWTQFKDHQAEEINADHSIQMKNNYNVALNTTYEYAAYEKYSGTPVVTPPTPVTINFDPFSTAYDVFPTFTIPSTTPNYDEDSMVVTFQYSLVASSDIAPYNDTLYYDLPFYNYYAYDDGSAERAYGLIGIGAKLAEHFHAYTEDTIREVYVHWEHVDGDVDDLFLSLVIWDQIDTTLATGDENIVFEADFLSPEYVDSINGFYVYKLQDFTGTPTPIAVNGDFYVGWLQTQEQLLNVGLDLNSFEGNKNLYFNVGGSWQKSSIAGSVMIRPQLGGDYTKYPVGIPEILSVTEFTVYPDPASNIIYFNSAVTNETTLQVFDQWGRMVKSENTKEHSLSVADLPSGFYILKSIDMRSGNTGIAKFIVNH